MSVFTRQTSVMRRSASVLAAMSTLLIGACATDRAAAPVIPGQTPLSQFRPQAFIVDVNARTGKVAISLPEGSTRNAPTLSLDGVERPNLSLLGGEAVQLVASDYFASTVGEALPGLLPNRMRVTFRVKIVNKLPGVRFITPTWPVAPAAGVILFPLDYVPTISEGSAIGGADNVITVEQPSRAGSIVPSINWNGADETGGGTTGGAPYSFFNDADCGLATSNDCFRWEAFEAEILPNPGESTERTIGFDIDPQVGQFRVRMIVAADLAPGVAPTPGTISGLVDSDTRGPLNAVTLTLGSGATGTTLSAGAGALAGRYTFAGVPAGSRTVTASNLPSGCTFASGAGSPSANTRTVSLASGATGTANFTATCVGLPGTLSGVVTGVTTAGLPAAPIAGVTVAVGAITAVTDAAGAYSLPGVLSGTVSFTPPTSLPNCAAASTAFTMPSGGTQTVNRLLVCTPPSYQYNTTWTNLPGNQVQLDIRIDMRNFNQASVIDVTTSGVTGDPLNVADISVLFNTAQLTYNAVATGDAAIPSPRLSPGATIGAGTPGRLNILNGYIIPTGGAQGVTGNVAIARIIFDRVAPAGTSVTTTTTFNAVSGRSSGLSVPLIPFLTNLEAAYVLPPAL